ncbi:MAG: hypothetical protein HY900_27730 [Deltaproteobacteria bacterium]|nr:hypothetical protein [Deltaproteobacteria bacterium]
MALFCGLVLAPPAVGQGAARDELLEATGIRYPEGFDLNTAGEVEGRASGLSIVEEGPVRFRLTVGREDYTVLTVPRWYWSELGIQMPEGSEVVVKGSTTVGKDGKLYVVAQELRIPVGGRAFTFRDPKGSPLWTRERGGAPGGSSPGQQGGSRVGPMRPGGLGGMGGMGGGLGGHRSRH